MESKQYVNPFIDVHKKAEALKKRAREEHEKHEMLREERSQPDNPISSTWNDGLSYSHG